MRVLQEPLKRIAEIAASYRLAPLVPQIEACRELLGRDRMIDVAVFGRFKAGKSSFLNNLAGREVLPVGVTPVTAVITRLRYGANERAEVGFLDGRRTAISLESVRSYVAESENPDNEKNVSSVDLELPSLKAYDGIRFVDTPGLGSVFRHNTEISLEWLPHVGAAVMAMSVDSALSQEDLDFLRTVSRHSPRIVLLLSKCDLKTEQELQEIASFVREGVKKENLPEWPLYFYSARPDFAKSADWKRAIERTLFEPLVRNRDEESEKIVLHKFNNILSECVDYLKIAAKAAGVASSEDEALRSRLFSGEGGADWMNDELRRIAGECSEGARPAVLETLNRSREDIEAEIIAAFEKAWSGWRGNLWKLSRTYEAWVEAAMSREMKTLGERRRAEMMGILSRSESRISRALSSFSAELSRRIEGALGVSVSPKDWQVSLPNPDLPDVAAMHAFAIHIDLIWFLIPMTLFRPFFHRRFRRLLPWEVEKNVSRSASQWSEAIVQAITAMIREAEALIRDEIRTLDALLSQSQSRRLETERVLGEVTEMRRSFAG